MKCIMLAAGKGTRISRMIDDVPKCTLPIGDKALIRYTAEMFLSLGIQPIVCVGYRYQKIYEVLEGLNVKFVHNPFYDVTNSIASLWFTRDELDDDMIIMNADVFLSREFLMRLIEEPQDVVMAADKSRITVGDYFFYTNEESCIRKYGKELPVTERSCEYVGIAKVAKSFIPELKQRLLELIDRQQHGLWWENTLYSFTDNNERNIYTMDVEGLFWSEIDYFDDYERILHHLEQIDAKKQAEEK